MLKTSNEVIVFRRYLLSSNLVDQSFSEEIELAVDASDHLAADANLTKSKHQLLKPERA